MSNLPSGSAGQVLADTQLLAAARAGDGRAWQQLIERHEGLLRRTARGFGLQAADVEDVVQRTWLALFEQLDTIRTPDALPGWLCTVTRRHALRVLQPATREVLLAAPEHVDPAPAVPMDVDLDRVERRAALATAFEALPERHRRIMLALSADPEPDYRTISDRLGVPVGSIGPIRTRCLERLARDPRLRALAEAPC